MTSLVKVCAVITTFQPDSVIQLVRSVAAQASDVVVVDDGSDSPPEGLPDEIHVIRCAENRGIAAALNVGLAAAKELGATHVLTLDQDSMIGPDFVASLTKFWSEAQRQGIRPGVLAPDDVGSVVYRGDARGDYRFVKEVMQSGALFSIVALEEAGGFDATLVIDGVDTDVCLRLRREGWAVLTCPVAMEHRLGNARVIRVLGRQVLLTRHRPFRDYYITRNRMLLLRRYWRSEPSWCLGAARRLMTAVVLTVSLDEDRRTKAAAIAAGIRDGILGRSGPLKGSRLQKWT
jgi:rhamnosyltransferase